MFLTQAQTVFHNFISTCPNIVSLVSQVTLHSDTAIKNSHECKAKHKPIPTNRHTFKAIP